MVNTINSESVLALIKPQIVVLPTTGIEETLAIY
tara:strand:+ start:2553 stop:2654 length:102 start_codon:yes stop_codon:yes gene_type:complete